tara:strand:+ start:1023 stop:1589 length:567 start_codon:yes stop_codon:yes gene_type:complete
MNISKNEKIRHHQKGRLQDWRQGAAEKYDKTVDSSSDVQWSAGETIYKVGENPDCAYLVVEGNVIIESPEGLKLNEIGPREIFGEASILIGSKRTVTAKAGTSGVKAAKITHDYLSQIFSENPLLSAVLRKIEMRLIDSNRQSEFLARKLGELKKSLEVIKDNSAKNEASLNQINKVIQEIENSNVID